ncbi:MAG TPA: DnaB-like helicase N-terminal domain-containing protein, partial [Elusimicrobiales bacterium]|nr:DnaB-like helicase N-terminal domain-containing protein [Elusimicrobiales bacterium]
MAKDPESMMEHAALGSVILESGVSDRADVIFEELKESDFSCDATRRIFRALKEMHDAEEAIDLVTLSARLRTKGEINQAGGEVFLAELINAVSTTSHAYHYAGQVKKNAIMRQIRRELSNLNPTAAPEDIERVMRLIQLRDSGDDANVVSAASLAEEYIRECEQGRTFGLKTGYPSFDANFHAQPGDLVVVAARTNVGKTAYLTNILSNMLEQQIPCLYCATEMRPKQFLGRI